MLNNVLNKINEQINNLNAILQEQHFQYRISTWVENQMCGSSCINPF